MQPVGTLLYTHCHSGHTTADDQDSFICLLHATRVASLVKKKFCADLGKENIGDGRDEGRHV